MPLLQQSVTDDRLRLLRALPGILVKTAQNCRAGRACRGLALRFQPHAIFSKTIPAAKLCDRASHQEPVARIRFCIGASLLGVITGEVGIGKTVATRQLDPAAHHVIYISTPTFGPRGLYVTIVGGLAPARAGPQPS